MAKQFFTNGTGSQQTLTPSQNEKVAIYDTVADAEADLTNLEEGQVVATPDTGDELAQPVDTVASGNMHAVTSNAVYNSFLDTRFKFYGGFIVNSDVCSDSDLYSLCAVLGNTRLIFLTGWVLVKAGTYTSGTKIFDLPANAMINQYVYGYGLTSVTPTTYQLYVENGSKEVIFNANITLPTMYIQFNQIIVTYLS